MKSLLVFAGLIAATNANLLRVTNTGNFLHLSEVEIYDNSTGSRVSIPITSATADSELPGSEVTFAFDGVTDGDCSAVSCFHNTNAGGGYVEFDFTWPHAAFAPGSWEVVVYNRVDGGNQAKLAEAVVTIDGVAVGVLSGTEDVYTITGASVTVAPTMSPTTPTKSPTTAPTDSPTTPVPSASPSASPTVTVPTKSPTGAPTTGTPTKSPTNAPTGAPTTTPTGTPTAAPTVPTVSPTASPTPTPPIHTVRIEVTDQFLHVAEVTLTDYTDNVTGVPIPFFSATADSVLDSSSPDLARDGNIDPLFTGGSIFHNNDASGGFLELSFYWHNETFSPDAFMLCVYNRLESFEYRLNGAEISIDGVSFANITTGTDIHCFLRPEGVIITESPTTSPPTTFPTLLPTVSGGTDAPTPESCSDTGSECLNDGACQSNGLCKCDFPFYGTQCGIQLSCICT